MSASLVGSEMCIRDRGLGPSGELGGQRVRWACSCFPIRGCEHSPIPSSCLLYTSDAADDM
eukprot:13429494-Alexandrium_andersonii.AAC.1